MKNYLIHVHMKLNRNVDLVLSICELEMIKFVSDLTTCKEKIYSGFKLAVSACKKELELFISDLATCKTKFMVVRVNTATRITHLSTAFKTNTTNIMNSILGTLKTMSDKKITIIILTSVVSVSLTSFFFLSAPANKTAKNNINKISTVAKNHYNQTNIKLTRLINTVKEFRILPKESKSSLSLLGYNPTLKTVATLKNSGGTSNIPHNASAKKSSTAPNRDSIELSEDTNPIPAAPVYVLIRSKNSTTFSAENIATVVSLLSKEGDKFKSGDTLLAFDCRIQQAELKKALAQAEATNIAYTSAKRLKTYGTISMHELIKAKTDVDIAKSDVEKFNAIVDKCTIKAPYNGSVSESMVQVGEIAKPGEPLLKIINNENLELQMQVPSVWLRWLHVGSVFKVLINETNKTVSAKVLKINPEINPISQTVKIIGIPITPDLTLLPGMSGLATFKENASTQLANPSNNANKIGG
jgi:membrane fusion protein (multidrug efflux system)